MRSSLPVALVLFALAFGVALERGLSCGPMPADFDSLRF